MMVSAPVLLVNISFEFLCCSIHNSVMPRNLLVGALTLLPVCLLFPVIITIDFNFIQLKLGYFVYHSKVTLKIYLGSAKAWWKALKIMSISLKPQKTVQIDLKSNQSK